MSNTDILNDLVCCTSCKKQVNPYDPKAVRLHPELKVIICKSCFTYYGHGDFEKDDNGIDNYCRWCGDGGDQLLCDECTNVFCKKCIRNNFSRSEALAMFDSEHWKCFVCNPKPLRELRSYATKILHAIETHEKLDKEKSSADKARSRSRQGDKPEKSNYVSKSSNSSTKETSNKPSADNSVVVINDSDESDIADMEVSSSTSAPDHDPDLEALLEKSVKLIESYRTRRSKSSGKALKKVLNQVMRLEEVKKIRVSDGFTSDSSDNDDVKRPSTKKKKLTKNKKGERANLKNGSNLEDLDLSSEEDTAEMDENYLSDDLFDKKDPLPDTSVTNSDNESAELTANKIAVESLKSAMLLEDESLDKSDQLTEDDADVDDLLTKKSKSKANGKQNQARDDKDDDAALSRDHDDSPDHTAEGSDEEDEPVVGKKSTYRHPLLRLNISSDEERGETPSKRPKLEVGGEKDRKTEKSTSETNGGNSVEIPDDEPVEISTDDNETVPKKVSDNDGESSDDSIIHRKLKTDGDDVDTDDSSEESDPSPAAKPSKRRRKFSGKNRLENYFSKLDKKEEDSSSDEFQSNESSSNGKGKSKGRKRLITRALESSSDEEGEDDKILDVSDGKLGRKTIRKIIGDEKLSQETKNAERHEKERRQRMKRLEEEQEVIVIEDNASPSKTKVTSRIILSKNPLVEIDSAIAPCLKPHQIDGVKFLWANLIESVKAANAGKGEGCVLAHCMGLGKTLQVICFLHSILNTPHLPSITTALVLCPMGTITNWKDEVRMWTKKCNRRVAIYNLLNSKTYGDRNIELRKWHKGGGIMIMGYNMYRSICTNKTRSAKRHMPAIMKCLNDPGPDIIVCDEGHLLKNSKSGIAIEVNKIKCKRRVVLTGTPLQNNLKEYHCMVSFIKPKLLGNEKEFANRFINPILNGQHVDSTSRDVRLMKHRSHILHELLSGCVQRKDISCLLKHLQPKFEYVIKVRLSELQIRLYENYMELKGCKNLEARKGCLFQDFQTFLLIVCHPYALEIKKRIADEEDEKKELNNMEKFIDDDDESSADEWKESSSSDEEGDKKSADDKVKVEDLPSMSISKLKEIIKSNGGSPSGCTEKSDLVNLAKSLLGPKDDSTADAWFRSVMPADNVLKSAKYSGKMMILLEILNLAAEKGDKVVVFSQSLVTLTLIEEILMNLTTARERDPQLRPENTKYWKWFSRLDYYRMDGSTNTDKRKKYIEEFNDKNQPRLRLFLISCRAGGIGINLIGANRAVLFDASWNPSHDVQSIFRIFRFGQKKPCFVYRLIAQGTMEEKIYDRQVTKQSLAFRVVDEQQIERHFTANDLAELYNFKPDTLGSSKKGSTCANQDKAPPKDKILALLIKQPRTNESIVSYHEHDTLLDHKADEELSEAERKSAWAEYDRERKPVVSENSPFLKASSQVLQMLRKQCEVELGQIKNVMENMKKPDDLYTITCKIRYQNPSLSTDEVQNIVSSIVIDDKQTRQKIDATYNNLHQSLQEINAILKSRMAAASNQYSNYNGAILGPNPGFPGVQLPQANINNFPIRGPTNMPRVPSNYYVPPNMQNARMPQYPNFSSMFQQRR